MTTLIVTLPQAPSETGALFDYVLTPDGNTVGEQSRVPLGLLPRVASKGGEVVAVVAASYLSWHQVQLPKGTLGRGLFKEGGAQRVRAVLEGLLEDRLLDDTAQLHFAIEPQPDADAPVWVAVCDRAWLRAGLQALEQGGLPVGRIVPEFTPDLPADTLHVLGDPDHGQLVFNAGAGVTVWPLSRASANALKWPEDRAVVAEPAVAGFAEELLGRNVTLQQGAQRALQVAGSRWDLAQFDLVNSSGARTWKRWTELLTTVARAPRWRPARFALLALLVVNVLGLNAWAWKEQAMVNAKRAAVRDLLTTTFPSVRVVVDAPIQMAKEVAALQQSSGQASGRDLEAMMGAFGAVAPAVVAPSAIEFAAGELQLKGLKLSADDVSALSFKLKPQGYAALLDGDSVVVKQGAGS